MHQKLCLFILLVIQEKKCRILKRECQLGTPITQWNISDKRDRYDMTRTPYLTSHSLWAVKIVKLIARHSLSYLRGFLLKTNRPVKMDPLCLHHKLLEKLKLAAGC